MKSNTARLVVSNALSCVPERYRRVARGVIGRIFPGRREVLASRYVRGSGIEIGAMQNPLRIPKGTSIQYVDYVTREQNLQRFTEIAHLRLVNPTIIEDGFVLPSFSASSVDFLIANHVLEHTDNALKTLLRWAEVVRHNGVLFLTVPLAEHCFDRGRPITTIDHFVSDYELERDGKIEQLRALTKQHYDEWLSISLPAVFAERGARMGRKNSSDMSKTAEQLLSEKAEIHFHTFSVTSYESLLHHFCANFRRDFELVEIIENGGEVIGILKRRGLPDSSVRARWDAGESI